MDENINKLSLKYQFSTKKGRLRFTTRVSMFAALSTVFYIFLTFPLPFLPSFLKINFSNLFIIVGSFLTGPVGGVIIIVMRLLLKLLIKGTSTMFVGELSDILLSLAVMLPSSLIYYKDHSKKGGYIGILFSFLSWIVMSSILNAHVFLPVYIKFFFNGDKSKIVGMLSSTIKNITESNLTIYYVLFGALPFNVINGIFNTGLACLVYKSISTILKKIGL